MTSLTRDRLQQLRTGAIVAPVPAAIFAVTGPGALTCLQGLLTNDLAKPGENSLVYGALLTPKGAIVVDHWVIRTPERFLLVTEPAGHAASLDLLGRSLPPRLAKVEDLSGTYAVLQVLGHGLTAPVAAAGLTAPAGPGRVAATGDILLATPSAESPFQALLVGPAADVTAVQARLSSAGAADGTADDVEAARILAGWPRLRHEILERTLIQEVRYDEIGGVSYTKGCYTGQETVARLHFRGHTNRELRGLVWRSAPTDGDTGVVDAEGKDVGRITSRLALPDRWIGLASVRREVATGTQLTAAGVAADLVGLPFTAVD